MRPLPVLAVVVLLACSSSRPSPEYEGAVALWNELVRIDPDRAAEDPRCDEVLERLGRVPARSSDAPAAAALRLRIESERRDHAAQRTRREELLGRAARPTPPVSVSAEDARGASIATPAAPPAPAAPAAPSIEPGLKAETFRKLYGACFAPGGEVALTPQQGGPSRPGEIWSLKDEARCRAEHAALVGQVVVLADGAVAAVQPASAVRRFEVRQDVQLATLPDGSPGMVVDGRIVPIPPGARVIRTDPGAPAP